MTLVEQKKEIKPILKKHVNTIHSSNNLTLVQRKLFNALLFNAYHDMPEKFQYEIPIKKLCNLIGYDSRDYKKLRKSILDLLTTAIEWNVIENDQGEKKEKWRASSIVAAAKIENGLCIYEFSSVMRELLYRPEIYGKIDIQIMTQFKSSYGLALYENCIRFQSIATTPWLPINTFRKLMGIAENRYQNFCDLKKRVLDIAVKEVNLYSPIKVVPEIKRVNKAVTSIKFKLLENKEVTVNVENDLLEANADLLSILKRDFNLSDKVAIDILDRYDPEFIQEKITLIKASENFRLGKIRELAAYFIDALKRDYKPSKSSQRLLNEIRNQEEAKIKAEKAKEDQLQEKAKKQRLEVINNYLGSLSEEALSTVYKSFEEDIITSANFYVRKNYKKAGLKNKSVEMLFNSYVIDIIDKNLELEPT